MPRLKGTGKGPTKPIPIRLGEDELAFYRRKANEAGRPLATHLALLLKEGVIAESAADIEARLRSVISDAASLIPRNPPAALPDEALVALFTAEALLAAIVEQRDTQALYDAQAAAKRKVAALKGAKNG